MSVYWITFRIAEDGNHDDRYDNLLDAIKKSSTMIWEEPTSFLLVESEKTIDDLAAILRTKVNSIHDIVLIGNPNVKQARVIGIVVDENLFEMMPFTKYA